MTDCNALFDAMAAWPQVEAIALGGSRAGTVFDEKSDYDVYLYCTAPVPAEQRRTLLAQFCSHMELGNHFWEYEDNCTLNDGVDIDILYRDLDGFCAELAAVVEQCRPHNGYTTCMWHNLRTCKVLFDRTGRLAAAKQRFDVPYPEALRTAIVRRGWRLLRTSLPAYETQLSKALRRGDLVSVNHRTAALMESYFDLLFALNRQTHPGEKRLMALCRAACPLLPRDFEQNLTALFRDLFTDPARAAADLRRLLDTLQTLLEQQGLAE